MLLKYVNGKDMIINESNILDQYFTKRKIAINIFSKVKEIISQYENIDNHIWIEPSVGEGCFLDLLPKSRRIGIDIDPKINSNILNSLLWFFLLLQIFSKLNFYKYKERNR